MKPFLILAFALQSACMPQKITAGNNTFEDDLRKGIDVLVQNKTINADLDFTQLSKPNRVSIGIAEGKIGASVTFQNCTFKGKIAGFATDDKGQMTLTAFGRNVSFLNCVFEREVSFRGCNIAGRADFTQSTFKQGVNFEEVTFGDNAFFNDCKFEGEVRFQNAVFQKKANFMKADFGKTCNFQSSVFTLEAQFGLCQFREYTDFSLTSFSRDALFNYAVSSKRLVFENATFSARCELMNVEAIEVNMRNCTFWGSSRFIAAKIIKQLSFENSVFWKIPELDDIAEDKLDRKGMTLK